MSSKFFKGGKYVYEKLVPKIAKNLTTKRSIQDKVVKAVDEGSAAGLKGKTPSPHLKQSLSKTKKDKSKELKGYSYKWEKLVSDRKKADKKLLIKTVGGAGAATTGAAVVHESAKRKWPKYKKVMEYSVIKKKK